MDFPINQEAVSESLVYPRAGFFPLHKVDIYSKANVYLNCFVDSLKVFTLLEKKVTSVSTKNKMWHKILATVLSQCRFYRGLVLRGQNSEAGKRWGGDF